MDEISQIHIYSGSRYLVSTANGMRANAMMLTVDEFPLEPSPFADDKFYGRMEYGNKDYYGGLALAHSILYTEYCNDHHPEHAELIADTHYQAFASAVISLLPSKQAEEAAGISIGWMLTSHEIRCWVDQQENK